MSSGNVFLSYSRKDETFVRQFYQRLLDCGVQSFFDKESIMGSSNWVKSLEHGLDSCQYFILFLAPHYFTSEWTEIERTVIFSYTGEQKKTIIPLMLEECTGSLPPLLKPIQHFDISTQEKLEIEFPRIIAVLSGGMGGMGGNDAGIKTTRTTRAGTTGDAHWFTRRPERSVELLGRENDVQELSRLLETSQRLVLVNGLGGVGKTELCKYVIRQNPTGYRRLGWVDYLGSLNPDFSPRSTAISNMPSSSALRSVGCLQRTTSTPTAPSVARLESDSIYDIS